MDKEDLVGAGALQDIADNPSIYPELFLPILDKNLKESVDKLYEGNDESVEGQSNPESEEGFLDTDST